MLQPLLDRILVRRLPTTSNSTIITPSLYEDKSTFGRVEAIGTHVVLGGSVFPLSEFVNVGDVVKFGEMNAEPYENDLLIVRIQDVRGKRVDEN